MEEGSVSGGGERQWGRGASVGESKSKFGEEIKSGDKLIRTMESSLKRSKGRYTRREERRFAVVFPIKEIQM